MCYNIPNCSRKVKCHKWINKNSELSVVFLSQPAVAERVPCREIERRLPWDKIFRLTQKKPEATNPNIYRKVTVATPNSCHSKEHCCTAHNLYCCNKFVLHKNNISTSVPNLHDIVGINFAAHATDHLTNFVQLTKSVKVTDSAVCCRFIREMQSFLRFLSSGSLTVVGI
jgi:anaerobic glycerol-3-phosphate dehydrogenase